MKFLRKIVAILKRHKLTAALLIAIAAALALVSVSMSMYYIAGFYRYDLSRPSYEKEREEIVPPQPQQSYNTTGPVTQAVIDDFLEEFDQRRANLNEYGDYQDKALSDQDLLLIVP